MTINETSAAYSINAVETLFSGHSPNSTQKEEDPLGRDAFLTMLVAQMKHQDPLNPLQGTDFTAQLAQYSSLEQQFNTNDLLSDIKSGVGEEPESNLLDYIGKEIVAETNTLVWKDGEVVSGSYTLENPGDVVVTIFDQEGAEIRRLYQRHAEAGTYQVKWDGYDSLQTKKGAGAYAYRAEVMTPSGVGTALQSSMSGLVTGVTYQHGTPYLQMGDKLVDPEVVLEVKTIDNPNNS
jgi:flagellar basal-body rod modification protein FlgD